MMKHNDMPARICEMILREFFVRSIPASKKARAGIMPVEDYKLKSSLLSRLRMALYVPSTSTVERRTHAVSPVSTHLSTGSVVFVIFQAGIDLSPKKKILN